mmetsp:Transcript_41536/g.124163  ORF Transcript_41536/g.124163 Transcript_41536/m.124163 type:complete len:312 (-) Transcript_41536:9-944(-)
MAQLDSAVANWLEILSHVCSLPALHSVGALSHELCVTLLLVPLACSQSSSTLTLPTHLHPKCMRADTVAIHGILESMATDLPLPPLETPGTSCTPNLPPGRIGASRQRRHPRHPSVACGGGQGARRRRRRRCDGGAAGRTQCIRPAVAAAAAVGGLRRAHAAAQPCRDCAAGHGGRGYADADAASAKRRCGHARVCGLLPRWLYAGRLLWGGGVDGPGTGGGKQRGKVSYSRIPAGRCQEGAAGPCGAWRARGLCAARRRRHRRRRADPPAVCRAVGPRRYERAGHKGCRGRRDGQPRELRAEAAKGGRWQ